MRLCTCDGLGWVEYRFTSHQFIYGYVEMDDDNDEEIDRNHDDDDGDDSGDDTAAAATMVLTAVIVVVMGRGRRCYLRQTM